MKPSLAHIVNPQPPAAPAGAVDPVVSPPPQGGFAVVQPNLGVKPPPSRLVLTLEGGKQKLLTTGGVIVEDGEVEYEAATGKWFVKLEVQMPEGE